MADEIVPSPDPTVLTTAQLMREINHLRELIGSRLDAMDKAVVLLQEFANRQPTIAEVVARYDERLDGIDAQFVERDRRFDLRDRDNVRAIDAALATSAAASQKTEATFTKQIDGMGAIINSQAVTLDDKIGDLRNRLTVVESRNGRTFVDYLGMAAGLGSLVLLLGVLLGYLVFSVSNDPLPVPLPVVQEDAP